MAKAKAKAKESKVTPEWYTQLTPGENYIVTDVTSMIYVGKLVLQDGPRIVLEEAAWVADTGGRMNSFIQEGRHDSMEIELVGYRTIYWAGWSPWLHSTFSRSHP